MKSLAADASVRIVDGIHIVTADASTLAFDHPFDLAQTSLRFKRADDHTFEVSPTPAAFDNDIGSYAHTFPLDDAATFTADLPFAFPFGTQQLSRLYFTGSNAILTTADPIPQFPQQFALDAVGRQRGMISPLFHPQPISDTHLYLKQTSDSLLVTWIAENSYNYMNYRLQARLGANGDVVFSYDQLANIDWGTVIVTTGQEPFYSDAVSLGNASDVAGDVSAGIRSQWRDILDFTSVQVRRLGGSDLIEFRLHLRGAIDRSKFADNDQFLYVVRFSPSSELDLLLGKSTAFYFLPDGTSSAFRIDGNVITLRALQSELPAASGSIQALTFDPTGKPFDQSVFADAVMVPASFPAAPATAESDLSALPQAARLQKPVFEAFTLPALDLTGIWNKIKSNDGLSDDQVDGIAVYQNFTTNIQASIAVAYSLIGNPRVDGIAAAGLLSNYGRDKPLYPNIMHMNRIGYADNGDNRLASFALAHEFAHRWLYHLAIIENGTSSAVLNPDGGHPAQWVHTAAAHAVVSLRDSSVMGGGNFADLGGGVFMTGDDETSDAYSAHELYLMGLAAADEVSPFFYLANSNPPLGRAYWAPANLTLTGTRKDVIVQQIIDALGPRVPAYDGAHRTYKVLYVIVERPGTPASDADVEVVSGYAAAFERRFAVATGFRGEILPPVEGVPVQSDFVFSATGAVAGRPMRFIDTSAGHITAWKWSFGDGQTSSFENPRHIFQQPGTYTVALQVGDGTTFTSTAAHPVTVAFKPRQRTVRH